MTIKQARQKLRRLIDQARENEEKLGLSRNEVAAGLRTYRRGLEAALAAITEKEAK